MTNKKDTSWPKEPSTRSVAEKAIKLAKLCRIYGISYYEAIKKYDQE